MQIVLATVTDAVLQPHPGPMAAGTSRMKDALTQVMLGYLGVSASNSWAGEEAEGENETEAALEADAADQNETPTDANSVYDLEAPIFNMWQTNDRGK